MRRVLALLLALTASASLVAACGDDQPTSASDTTAPAGAGVTDSSLDDVKVTGAEGEPPELEFDTPFGVAETASEVITEGDGDDITATASVTFDYVLVNGTDAKEVDSSYDREPTTVPLSAAPQFLVDALTGQKAGARVLIAISAADGFGADEQRDIAASDTLLMVVDVTGVPLTRAEGTAVAPVDGLPTVVLAADGAPTITVPEGEAPTELIVQPLIEGTGPAVESGQTITVHYTGVLYSDGSVFDSSWESGTPASFPIGTGGVIPGWDKGLVGKTVGSQILLVVPPADGYGDAGQGESIPPGATLVFVVDILAAS